MRVTEHRLPKEIQPPVSAVKFKAGAGGEEKSKCLTSIQVISIQVQDCLSCLVSNLCLGFQVCKTLLAVCPLSASDSRRGTHAFAWKSFHKMSALL